MSTFPASSFQTVKAKYTFFSIGAFTENTVYKLLLEYKVEMFMNLSWLIDA